MKPDKPPPATGRARKIAGIVVGVPILGVCVAGFFWLAGRWDWIEGWAYVGLFTLGQSVIGIYLLIRDPELIRRRARAGEGTKAWDKVCLSLFGCSYLAIMVVAALDARWGWSETPAWLVPAGGALYVLGAVLVTWAMAVNTHFEKTVRIQTDRGHKVIDSGPYRLVRHPGYVATILGFVLAPPLMLRSRWALLPAAVAVSVFVLRTALEDRMLRRELEGYAEYAKRVRYRLLPPVW